MYNTNNETLLSVIVPLAPFGEDITKLLDELKKINEEPEIIFVTSNVELYEEYLQNNFTKKYILIKAESGRANCLNAGADIAQGRYLLFLHVDSIFSEKGIPALLNRINHDADSLLYFDLIFHDKFTILLKLNEISVFIRSRLFKSPFGDQGFCIKKELFHRIGGYRINAPYGEDHLFVRDAIENNIPLENLKEPLYTSSRKYKKNGWAKTTAQHLYLWLKQFYEYKKSVRSKRK